MSSLPRAERLAPHLYRTPPGYAVTVESQGGVFKVSTSRPGTGNPRGTKRGTIKGFTAKSRRRMLEKVSRVDFEAVPVVVFITLTYPAEFPDSMTAKAHLRALLERFRRHFPKASGIWRLEYQERGAPHFHLLMFHLPYLPKETLRAWWQEVIGSESWVNTGIEAVASRRKAVAYVSKYMAKETDSCVLGNVPYPHEGRFWGVFNRPMIPWAQLGRVVIGWGKWVNSLRRSVCRCMAVRVRGFRTIRKRKWHPVRGFNLFTSNTDPWWRLTCELVGVT